eukprot:CAMPEP_0180179610 /NCGR_PEP_ID=MMETSP0986-20121125/39111_1 /TAXON_ID=697907 /ORGANISM="non described non described, Strain CCMP2293" /LENGTH=83 /DNA_ID=CAMNT_0022132697 /DNA_START=27 /DNA_END=274 /DNA_ORIENTATION=+
MASLCPQLMTSPPSDQYRAFTSSSSTPFSTCSTIFASEVSVAISIAIFLTSKPSSERPIWSISAILAASSCTFSPTGGRSAAS